MIEKSVIDDSNLRKRPKRQQVKYFLAASETFLTALFSCNSLLAKQMHRELDNVVSRIRMYYE